MIRGGHFKAISGMASKRRYFLDDDTLVGVTPSALKKMGRARQKEYLQYWFAHNFEDPAENTPYESAEGGYLYIWGGPYNAADELYNQFGDVVSEKVIDEVAEELASGGIYDWAPSSNHPDFRASHDEGDSAEADDPRPERPSRRATPDLNDILDMLKRGSRPSYGDEFDVILRNGLIVRLDQLIAELGTLRPVHGGLGHNRPPADEVLNEVIEPATAIREELKKTTPDAIVVAEANNRLYRALGWLKGKAEVTSESFAKSFGSTLGKISATAAAAGVGGLLLQLYPDLQAKAAELAMQVTDWLAHVTSVF